MDKEKTQEELLRENYQERAKHLNGLADAALSEAIEHYARSQENTVDSAKSLAVSTVKKAEHDISLVLEEKEKEISEAVLAAYVDFGLRV